MASLDDIREELRQLGEERLRLDKADADLVKRIRKALDKADGKIPTTESASLLGLHRTTIYRVYRPARRAA